MGRGFIVLSLAWALACGAPGSSGSAGGEHGKSRTGGGEVPPRPGETVEDDPDGVETALKTEPETAADRMWHHFWDVVRARDALVRGDLDGSRVALSALEAGEYGIEIPQEWIGPLSDMQADAARGARADDLEGVAKSVAAVGLHCGECHRQVAGRSVLPEGDTRGYEAHGRIGVSEAMARHQWAMAELWLGLTSPRHADWIRGADALNQEWEPMPADAEASGAGDSTAAGAESDSSESPSANTAGASEPSPELAAAIARVRELGPVMREARTPHARAAKLATLFVRCAGCHQQVGLNARTGR